MVVKKDAFLKRANILFKKNNSKVYEVLVHRKMQKECSVLGVSLALLSARLPNYKAKLKRNLQ